MIDFLFFTYLLEVMVKVSWNHKRETSFLEGLTWRVQNSTAVYTNELCALYPSFLGPSDTFDQEAHSVNLRSFISHKQLHVYCEPPSPTRSSMSPPKQARQASMIRPGTRSSFAKPHYAKTVTKTRPRCFYRKFVAETMPIIASFCTHRSQFPLSSAGI